MADFLMYSTIGSIIIIAYIYIYVNIYKFIESFARLSLTHQLTQQHSSPTFANPLIRNLHKPGQK